MAHGFARLSILALMIPVALASLLLAALLLWPYSPYSVYGSQVKPPETCPGSDVEVRIELSIDSEAVEKIEVESTWRPTDGEGPESGGGGTILDPERTPRSTIASPVVRQAPTVPGRYRLYTETDVVGTFEEGNLFHGFPKFQRAIYESDDLLRVLPSSDPRCSS